MDFVKDFAAGLSGTVWGWPEVFPLMVAALLVTGLVMTVTLRFLQMRRLKHSLDVIRGKYDDPSHDGRPVPLPGPDHGFVRNHRDRQHRRSGHRPALRRAGRPVLDVGDGDLRDGPEIRGVHPGDQVPRDPARRQRRGRSHVLHREGIGPLLEAPGGGLRGLRGHFQLRFGQQHPGLHRGRPDPLATWGSRPGSPACSRRVWWPWSSWAGSSASGR